MAKRRAEDPLLLHRPPSKRCTAADLQLVPTRAGSDLLALLGRRCRKRPHYFQEQPEEEEEAADVYHKEATCCRNVQTSGSFQEGRGSTSCKKRAREDSETVTPEEEDQADEDSNAEDCTYNSFQYWRPPLPELDLSLLEEADVHSQTKDKSKVGSSSDAMET